MNDISPATKTATVDDQVEDDVIRDALKRELLLYASVTNRGEYATQDEQVRPFQCTIKNKDCKVPCYLLIWSARRIY
jgi:hypothetical protein